MLYIGLYRENMNKSSCLKQQGYGMKNHLVDPYQVCSYYAPGAKNGLSLGSHVLHRFIKGKHENIYLSETTRPRAFIFGM